MKKSKVKQLCAVALAATLGLTVLAGCGSKKTDKAATSGKQELVFNLAADPKTLDPGLNQAVDGSIVDANAFEGLCKLDESGKAIPGQAEKWEVSDDKLTYTFHLKKDLKWSNGDPVKASDFEYAWKRVLNPETASIYSFQLLYLKGGEEYNTGKGTADQVGVKATDDSTLVVTLAAPCPYFLELTSSTTYMPVDQKIVEGNKDWAKDAKTLVSNGPFKFTDYKIKDQIVLEKNENYPDKDKIKLDKITMKMVTENTSAWASYKTGQFDMVYSVPSSEIEQAIKDKTATTFKMLGTQYVDVNVSDKAKEIDPNAAKVLSNAKFREALANAIDRTTIVEKVLKSGQTPAHSFVAPGITAPDGKDFANKKYFEENGDIEKAKKLLAEAGYPDGQGLPPLVVLYNPENGNGELYQAIQDMWKKIGVNVELQTQEWKVFQATRDAKNYEMARGAWTGDYSDPMTFVDMFISTSPNNEVGYNNPKYDQLVDAAKNETDANKRFDILHQAEDLLMEEMPIIPLYHDTKTFGIKDYVKGVRVSPLGYIYFDSAYIEGKK
ncbi:peptide ABC transporter substrate-binding protein [Clostridium beijerinckii]|uniref:Oligopeptide transport system substrate-binding protein n=1 Tax=Clostridium beijerinckii TaxID=1520 RepID=A0A9Q5CUS5_CLOBE|nr:peptide ABC transporter substrate-binding protein [Clostridium beijerinckii]AQS07795.1 dipeptide-binding protein DppE precursor [Clostridium beijerinckii]MBA2887304.1 oligopeptide transport system substrate-binding protein [Clostridium beijerinckii]MBA2902096.1 oligopeptide transport system substrate-binding protein [Clostridium beijerinckii]MBA2912017.1 oligopeptide transport system substrate-binding protein [Clostridium beijerinckii]MBA9017986.1 oligopeptide transport system substrate-bin